MKTTSTRITLVNGDDTSNQIPQSSLPAVIEEQTQIQLLRMFRDPYVIEKDERKEMIARLREAVELQPGVAELRVILGMALCVDFDGQAALEELRQAVHIAPDSFIAHLKFGELLMRLRICNQAADETAKAAKLASSALQSELARRQAGTIRTMLREGIERGGYAKYWNVFARLFKRPDAVVKADASAALSPR